MKEFKDKINNTLWALSPPEIIILATALTGWRIIIGALTQF